MALWHSEAGVDRPRAIQYGVLVMTLSSTPNTVTEWLSLKLKLGGVSNIGLLLHIRISVLAEVVELP